MFDNIFKMPIIKPKFIIFRNFKNNYGENSREGYDHLLFQTLSKLNLSLWLSNVTEP